MVVQPTWSGSPTTTAMAPLLCMFRTFSINEQPPRSSNAIQFSDLAGSTTEQPDRSDGSIKNP
jgi:hypothetical protein